MLVPHLAFKSALLRAPLVVQGMLLPMQGMYVRSLVLKDPTRCRATKPVHHNYEASSLEPKSHNYEACMLQRLKPVCLEPLLHNKRSHHNESAHDNEEKTPLTANRESLLAAMKTNHSQKIKQAYKAFFLKKGFAETTRSSMGVGVAQVTSFLAWPNNNNKKKLFV